IAESPLIFAVNAKLPYKTIKDVITASKNGPEPLRYGSAGNGSSSHLAMDVLRVQSGMPYMHVPYRGGGPAMLDVAAGRLDLTAQPVAEISPFIKDGRLRPLAQTGAHRTSIVPDLPTVDEAGVNGYSAATWYVLLGPANMPKELVETIHAQVE